MTKTDNLGDFKQQFRTEELLLHEYSWWTLSLRPQQVTFGSMVLSSRIDVTDFSRLPTEAGRELIEALGDSEGLAKTLGASRVNVLALMMRDPLVHFHVLPRYPDSVDFGGRIWTDLAWPGPPTLQAAHVSEPELKEIHDRLRDALSRQLSDVRPPSPAPYDGTISRPLT